jgi:hypothetical protein
MVKRLSARMFSSTFWMISPVTGDGLHHEHHFFPLQIHDTISPQHLRRKQKQVGDEFQQQFLLSHEDIELLHEPHIWRHFKQIL